MELLSHELGKTGRGVDTERVDFDCFSRLSGRMVEWSMWECRGEVNAGDNM